MKLSLPWENKLGEDCLRLVPRLTTLQLLELMILLLTLLIL